MQKTCLVQWGWLWERCWLKSPPTTNFAWSSNTYFTQLQANQFITYKCFFWILVDVRLSIKTKLPQKLETLLLLWKWANLQKSAGDQIISPIKLCSVLRVIILPFLSNSISWIDEKYTSEVLVDNLHLEMRSYRVAISACSLNLSHCHFSSQSPRRFRHYRRAMDPAGSADSDGYQYWHWSKRIS